MESAIEFLKEELDRVNHWLSFAEAKNAAFLVFNMSLLGAMLKFNQQLYIFHYIILCAVGIGGLLSIISFFPCMGRASNQYYTRVLPTQPNLILYSDIAKMSAKDYASLICSEYFPLLSSTDLGRMYSRHLIEEIVVNSCITYWKCRLSRIILIIDSVVMILIIFRMIYLGSRLM